MSRPVMISQVVSGMTLTKYAKLEEEHERMAAVNIRLGMIEAEAERRKAWAKDREAEAIVGMGRGEYTSLRAAAWKERLYQRAIKRDEWDAFQLRKIQGRVAERAQKKADMLDFDPESVPTTYENLPNF